MSGDENRYFRRVPSTEHQTSSQQDKVCCSEESNFRKIFRTLSYIPTRAWAIGGLIITSPFLIRFADVQPETLLYHINQLSALSFGNETLQ